MAATAYARVSAENLASMKASRRAFMTWYDASSRNPCRKNRNAVRPSPGATRVIWDSSRSKRVKPVRSTMHPPCPPLYRDIVRRKEKNDGYLSGRIPRRQPGQEFDKPETVPSPDPPRPAGTPAHRGPVCGPAALQLRLRRRLSAGRRGLQDGPRRRRRRPVRHARVQPLDSRGAQERDRLGEPSIRQEQLRAKALGGDRHVARQDRHGGGPATPAQHHGLLQLAADELDRGLYPVRKGLDHRR